MMAAGYVISEVDLESQLAGLIGEPRPMEVRPPLDASSSEDGETRYRSNSGSLENGLVGVLPRPTPDRTSPMVVALRMTILGVLCIANAYGQTDPWSNMAGRMGGVFSGPIAKGLGLTAIVVGGLEVAFGEGGSRRAVGGLIFGLGLALGAASFMSWLFS